MRGKADTIRDIMTSTWITPAYAGKSCTAGELQRKRKDHPRLCGEKQLLQINLPFLRRITPAYAGKRIEINSRGCWH